MPKITRDVPEDRSQFIADLANDEWIGRLEKGYSSDEFDRFCEEWERRTEDFLATVTDPAELHLFADLWNWDADDLVPLQRVIDNPACERATALLLFWRAQPEENQYYASADEIPERYRKYYHFVREIERRYLQGSFAEGSLRYDPREDYKLARSRNGIQRAMEDIFGDVRESRARLTPDIRNCGTLVP